MNALKGRGHYIVYGLLIIGIIWAMCREQKGRYQLAVNAQGGGMLVLDTKTSQFWARGAPERRATSVYLGTNQNPKFEVISE